jgi:mutual gliding-motility protein MglA
MEANQESLENLALNLSEHGYDINAIPLVIQYNKRDLPNAAPSAAMREVLNPRGLPEFEAIATQGDGVFDTLKSVAKSVLKDIKKKSQS